MLLVVLLLWPSSCFTAVRAGASTNRGSFFFFFGFVQLETSIWYHLMKGSPSRCCLPEIPGLSQVKRRNTGVPILRARMSVLVQYHIRLCITTPPVITFGALYNSSPCVILWGGDIQRIPVVKWLTFLGFDKAYHRGGIL